MSHLFFAKFNDPNEFLDELETEAKAGHLDYPVVRFTRIDKPLEEPLTCMIAIATVLVQGNLLRLEYVCGTNWGFSTNDDAEERLAGIAKEIEEHCKRLGLEFRRGMFEQA